MASRFTKIIDMFVRNHDKNPYPNAILFGAMGSMYNVYINLEDEFNKQKVYRKLDINSDNVSTIVLKTQTSMVLGGALGGVYGWIAGPFLFPILAVGSGVKVCSYALDHAEKLITVSS